jgi:hypothetical protein
LVKFSTDNILQYGEVQYFFQATVHNCTKTLALQSTYSPPDQELLRRSFNTLWTCRYQGAEALRVIDVTDIHSVVAMVPLPHNNNLFFVGEKLGLDVAMLGGIEEDLDE